MSSTVVIAGDGECTRCSVGNPAVVSGGEGEFLCCLCAGKVIRYLRSRLEHFAGRRFPIMGGPSLPWAMIAPHEAQAKTNHGQTLEQLAERGGLSPSEALMTLDDVRILPGGPGTHREDLQRRIDAYEERNRAQGE